MQCWPPAAAPRCNWHASRRVRPPATGGSQRPTARTAQPATGIHVIGEASKATLPKAGHVTNQEGKFCADAILRAFSGQPAYATPTANSACFSSACFSAVSSTLASWLTAVYR